MDTNPSEEIRFRALLKQFRKRKNWTQKQLAKEIGVSPDSVSFWERGYYKPETDRVVYKIADKLGLAEQEKQQLFEAYTVTALATSFHNPPFKQNLYFTGRSAPLEQLHNLLMIGKQVALTQAISGLGGIGKTQLALEYAYRHQKSYHDILWVNADTGESWMASYIILASLLHLPEHEEADQNKTKDAIHRWLGEHTNWLLILDNVEDFNLLHSLVPKVRNGAVLITTRRKVTEPAAQALELELLPENDAILFLLKRTKVLTVNQSLEEGSKHDIEAAKSVARLLGNLPLALDQAGAYILETPCSFTGYLTLFQTYQGQLLQRRIGEHMPTDHPESVTTTFRLNFERVQQRNHAAAELLSFFAFLAPDAIPEEILTAGAQLPGSALAPVVSDMFQLNQAIEVLYTYSLVQRDFKGKTLSVHRLVQAVIKDSLNQKAAQKWVERTVQVINAAFPDLEPAFWPLCEALLPHALLAARYIEEYRLSSDEAGSLAYKTALYLHTRARYKEAEPLYRQALRLCEQQWGSEHVEVAAALNGLADLCRDVSKYAEAETCYLRALSIREQKLGKEHLDVAMSLEGVAILYKEQGRYMEAEKLHLRSLAIRERQLGPEHLQVAASLNGLGLLYKEQSRYAEAEESYLRSLAIRKRQLGLYHVVVAASLNNLGVLYMTQGRYAEAEEMHQQGLAISRQVYGEEHPSIAWDLNNLAIVYCEQGKYVEAVPLLEQARQLWSQYLGETHPHVARAYNNLAEILMIQGEYAEVEQLYRQALNIWEQQPKLEHPDAADPLNGLATFYREQGRYAEAKQLYSQALRIRERELGPEHPETAVVMYHIAMLWEAQDNQEEAEMWYARVLVIREKALGMRHPKTTEVRYRRRVLLYAMGRHEEAATLEAVQAEQDDNGQSS